MVQINVSLTVYIPLAMHCRERPVRLMSSPVLATYPTSNWEEEEEEEGGYREDCYMTIKEIDDPGKLVINREHRPRTHQFVFTVIAESLISHLFFLSLSLCYSLYLSSFFSSLLSSLCLLPPIIRRCSCCDRSRYLTTI